jgi:glycosyltransferase involved in cell wall biosynthesis
LKILLDTGYLPEVVRPRGSTTVYGLIQANEAFVRALLKYGSFEEYHFLMREPLDTDEQADMMRHLYSLLPGPRLVRLVAPGHLHAYLKEAPYDVWHRGDPLLAEAVYLRDYVASRPFPVTGVTHALSSVDLKGHMLKMLVGGTASFDGIACTSAAGRQVLERLAGIVRQDLDLNDRPLSCELRDIPLAVDTDLFKPRGPEARERLGWPADRFIFTCIARMAPHAKMEMVPMLKAYGMVAAGSARARHSRLYIIGREQAQGYASVLMHMAKLCGVAKQVNIVTDYDPADIPLMHAASDCFLSLSDHVQETFGLTPLEAMASGVPPIVSDWDGYRETVVNGECGLTVPTYWADGSATASLDIPASSQSQHFYRLIQSVAVDVPALSRAMMQLIEDEDMCRRMGEAGRRRVLDHYSWPGVIAQYEAWWRELRERMDKDEGACVRNLFTFSHFDAFSHYATRLVDDATQVRVSDRAAPIYSQVMEMMDEELCRELTTLCPEWTGVGELFRKLKLKTEDRERFNFNLMVLIKYDTLAVKFPKGGQSPQPRPAPFTVGGS